MPTFLDTHVWMWWVTQDRRLSRRASRAIQDEIGREGVSLSMISLWEVAKKVEKQQLVLDRPIREWIDQAISVSGLHLVELTPSILIDSCALPQPFHGDPADQLIVASARHYGARLLTKDRNLRRYQHIQTIW